MYYLNISAKLVFLNSLALLVLYFFDPDMSRLGVLVLKESSTILQSFINQGRIHRGIWWGGGNSREDKYNLKLKILNTLFYYSETAF